MARLLQTVCLHGHTPWFGRRAFCKRFTMPAAAMFAFVILSCAATPLAAFLFGWLMGGWRYFAARWWMPVIYYGALTGLFAGTGFVIPGSTSSPTAPGPDFFSCSFSFTALIGPALALFVIASDLRFRHPFGHCQTCGYNLTGNVSGVCPECGTPT